MTTLPLNTTPCGPRGNLTNSDAPGAPPRRMDYDSTGNVVRQWVGDALSSQSYSNATSFTLPSSVTVAGSSQHCDY